MDLEQAKNKNKELLESVGFDKLSQPPKSLDEDEIKEMASQAEILWKRYFENELNKKILEQLWTLGTEIKDEKDLLFVRGTLNGLLIIKNWFMEQINISMSRFNKEE